MRQIDNQLLRLRRAGTNGLTGEYLLGYGPDLEDQIWMAARERLPQVAGDYPLDGEGFTTLGVGYRIVKADAISLGLLTEANEEDQRLELVRFLNHALILAYVAEVDVAIKGLLALQIELIAINDEPAVSRTRMPFQIRKDLEFEDDSAGDDPADRDDIDR